MYRGALVTILRILFCSLCSISMFDWDAAPHNGMPCIQMGFNMNLCMSSSLVRESLDFLPMIQFMSCSINPSCLRLLWICGCQVSRRSKCIPRYLTAVSCGIIFALRETAGLPSLRRVKVMCVDLDSFVLMRHFLTIFLVGPDAVGGVELRRWDRCVMPGWPCQRHRWQLAFVRRLVNLL